MPEIIKVLSYSKNYFNNYIFIEFQNSYKKRKKTQINYIVTVECILMSQEDIVLFNEWYQSGLSFGTSSFSSWFEARESEDLSNYVYKFYEEPTIRKGEGDLYYLTLTLVRLVEACSIDLINLSNALINIKKIASGINIGIDAHTSAPLEYLQMGVALTNIKNMMEESPNDYKVSRVFA